MPTVEPEKPHETHPEGGEEARTEGSQDVPLVEPETEDEAIGGPHGPDTDGGLGTVTREEVRCFRVALDPEILNNSANASRTAAA